ncbi:MAG: DUF2971 domain-containing protein [Candidatus Omnitrophica bacterium]|nr:DUF2971 domain-containing protein [Candidatus Omnitrophota bacterium]
MNLNLFIKKYICNAPHLKKKPEFLFKYYKIEGKDDKGVACLERIKKILIDSEIYFAKPLEDFNDLFDCKPLYKIIGSNRENRNFFKKIIKDYRNDLPENQLKSASIDFTNNDGNIVYAERELQNRLEKMINEYRIFCMSDVPDNILMWAYYADSHKGICLKFCLQEDRDIFKNTFKVRYEKRYPIFNHVKDNRDKLIRNSFFIKSFNWHHEGEWRAIYKNNEGVHPYKEGFLNGIIFGANINSDKKSEILSWVNGLNTKPKKYQAKLKKGFYGIDIETD